MKLSEIRDVLKADVLVGEDQMDKNISGCGSADLMEDVLSAAAEGAVLLSGLTTAQVVETARMAGVGALVFVRGKTPEKGATDLARTYNLPVLLTRHSLFVASGKLYMNGLRGLNGSW